MTRAVAIAGSCVAACVVGIALGLLTCHSIACRDALGVAFGRGHLIALTQGQGVYEKDFENEVEKLCYANDQDDVDSIDEEEERAVLSRLIATVAVRQLARNETVLSAPVERAINLVRDQFHEQKAWLNALKANHLSARSLRSEIEEEARAVQWLERQLAEKISRDESRRYFREHQQYFFLPERFRASHLFLAAPAETPAPVIDLKRRTIDSVSVRLNHGEEFSDLVRIISEDEASKTRGGDIGFFSASRMPSDFFSTIQRMQAGAMSPPIQTSLGFHIVQLTDRQPRRQMAFEEVEAEILLKLENEKRIEASNRLVEKWLTEVTFLRPEF